MVMGTSAESAALGDPFPYLESKNVAYETFAVIEYDFFGSPPRSCHLNLLKSL